jgi:hypothetical protein
VVGLAVAAGLSVAGLLAAAGFLAAGARAAEGAGPVLLAGAAREDITPPLGLPLWGYGGRKDLPSTGVRDRLEAAGVVLAVGEERVALVGLDLGRAPARRSMETIRKRARDEAGVAHLFLVGSHTHHGPCVELEDTGATAEYVRVLEDRIVRLIVAAARAGSPAVLGVAARRVPWNRNRHSKIEPRPVDDLLTVVRIDAAAGSPIATLVNFAAHPTTLPATLLEWSADFPGPLRAHVEKELGGVCVFLQGACGDLSTDRKGLDTDAYGRALGGLVVELARGASTAAPLEPCIKLREEEFSFGLRVDLEDPVTYLKYTLAFFKDLVDAYRKEYKDGLRPSITVGILNGDLGLVGVSGEVFASHAVRLRERARLPHLLFLGYANGYHQYFPTIEAVAEGGYGADPEVSPAEVGAGERMMDRALFHLFDLRKPIRSEAKQRP